MATLPKRVIKLGGSLLDCITLKVNFQKWLAAQSPGRNVIVVGGGRLADQVRFYDALHDVPFAAHQAAVLTMSATARLAASLLDGLPVVTDCDHLRDHHSQPSTVVLDPFAMLAEPAGPSREVLPCGWHVTSDSIAAHLASRLDADELFLLKSSLPPAKATWHDVAESGFVDPYFLRCMDDLSCVTIVDLRDSAVRQWRPQDASALR